MIDVTKFGIACDGVTDNTAALAALVGNIAPDNWAPTLGAAGVEFYFPPGLYLFSRWDVTRLNCFALVGDPGATLNGFVSCDYLAAAKSGTCQWRGLTFAGGAIITDASNLAIDDCAFPSLLTLGTFGGAVRGSRFTCPNIALIANVTGTLVSGCDFSGCAEAIRAGNAGLSIEDSSFEKCAIGTRLGVNAKGGNQALSRSALRRLKFTDCSTSMRLESVGTSILSDIDIEGAGDYGIYANYIEDVVVAGVKISSGMGKYGIFVYSGKNSSFYNVQNASAWGGNAGMSGIPYTPARTGAPLANVSVSSDPLVLPQKPPVIDVTTLGLKGDRNTDNSAAFQSLLSSSQPGTAFKFPAGFYNFKSVVTMPPQFSIVGECAATGGVTHGSTLLFSAGLNIPDWADFSIDRVNLFNSMGLPVSPVISANLATCRITNSQIGGVNLANPLNAVLESVSPTGSGITISGGRDVHIESCNFVGLQPFATSAKGTRNLALFGNRFESNAIAMDLQNLIAANVSGNTFEANNIHIRVNGCRDSLFAGIGSQGSTNAPSGMSQTGLLFSALENVTFAGGGMGGAYSGYAVQGTGPAKFINWQAGNGANPSQTWNAPDATRINCQ